MRLYEHSTIVETIIELIKASLQDSHLKSKKSAHKGMEYSTQWSGPAPYYHWGLPQGRNHLATSIGQVVETPTAQYV